MRPGLAALGGVIVGVAVGASIPREEAPRIAPAPGAQEVPARLPLPVPGLDRAAPLEGAPVECEASCRARIAAVGCVEPLAWPEGESPARAEEEIRGALAECDELRSALVELDCGEYPCVLWFRLPSFDAPRCAALQRLASERYRGTASTMASARGGGSVQGLWLIPRDLLQGGDLEVRQQIRMREAVDLIDGDLE